LAFLTIFTGLGCAKVVAARQQAANKRLIIFFKADSFFVQK